MSDMDLLGLGKGQEQDMDLLGLRKGDDPFGIRANRPVAQIPEKQTPEPVLIFGGNEEAFNEFWDDFVNKKQAEREKDFYSLVVSADTGIPPSLIKDQTETLPENWVKAYAPTVLRTVRQFLEFPKSLGEIGLSLASGMVGWGVSSVLGIAEATKPGATRESVLATKEAAAERLMFEPRTEPARQIVGLFGQLIHAATGPAREAAALVGESWDSPLLEAVLTFAGEAAILKMIGAGAEKIHTPPEWYYRLTVKERGVVEGLKKDIANGDLTPEDVRYLWKDPANRAELLKRYQGVAEEPAVGVKAETAPKVTAPPSGETLAPRTGEVSAPGEIVAPGATSGGYQGQHRPMTVEGGAGRLHDLEPTFGLDIYGPKAIQYFGTGDNALDRQTLKILKALRGKPEAEVTIYRAIPKDETATAALPGDWVTVNKQYAQEHGEGILGGDFKIIQQTVKAKDLTTNADSFNEQGYYPELAKEPYKVMAEDTGWDDVNAVIEMAARSDEVTMPPQTTEYDKIRAQAAQIAYTNLSKKHDLKKRRESAQIRRQGMEDARLDPIFTAMNEIVAGGGLNREWLLKTYDKDTVNELAKKHVGLVTKEGTLGLDVYADQLEFPSDDALMNALLGWQGLKEVGRKAAADFEERMSDLISEAEKEDFHLMLLEEEAKILRRMIKETGKPSAPGIKKVIREQTGQIRVEELMVSEWDALNAGMKKAEQASRIAFREGKLDGALLEKERQIEMATARRDKLKAKQEARDIHDGIIKLTKDKGIPEEYQDRIADLLEDFDLLPRSTRMAGRVESAREFLERQQAAGEDITIPESMLARIERYGKIHWRQMTLDQLREVYDQAKMYAHLGKLKNKLIARAQARDFETVVEKIVSEINKNWGVRPVSPAEAETMFLEESTFEKLAGFKESYLASLTKVETYLRRLDGFKDMGPLWETVYLPIKQASDVEFRKLTEITAALQALFAPMKKTLTKEKFRVPGVEQFLTKETAIMTAMNSGNEGNLTALKENKVYGWDDPKIAAILAKVTPEEWALVRGVWDLFEQQYPDLAAVYKNLSGVTLTKVEGDYFPLVFDRKLSWIADRNATEKELRDFFQSIYTLPSVKTGSTIERVGGKLPPKLKFTVIFEKLAEINHYITHAEAVRDVQKILGDPRVRAAIESAPPGIGGPEAYREMTSWLQDVARQRTDPMSAVEAAIKTARINTTTVAMAWKFSTAAVQFLGATNSIYKVGTAEFTKALAEFYTHREAMVEKIKGMSAEVAGRSKSFDRELRDAYNRIGLDHFRNSHVMKDTFFSLISTMDMAVAYPTWLAAYNKSMKETPGEEAKAIEYADMILRTTQGAGLAKDLAGIQRGAEMKKILSMFYTYFSAYHQMMSDAWVKFKYDKTGANFADLFKAWWWLTILPATFDYMMKEREVPSPGKFVENVLQQRLTAYPVIRDMTGLALTDFDYQFSPVARAGEVIGKTVKEAAKIVQPGEELDIDKLFRYGLESSGYIFGLPTGQAIVTMQGLIDLKNGDTTDLTRLLFRAPRGEED